MRRQVKRLISLALALLLLLTMAPALALTGGGAVELGNSPLNSLNGGMMVQLRETLYWADPSGIYAGETLLVAEAGRNLNVMRGGLYYTVAGDSWALRRYDLGSGDIQTLFTWGAPIDQLFITGGSMALFLSEGRVYRANLRELGDIRAEETSFSVSGFIPTAYGMIYGVGSLGNFTIYAGERLVESGVTLFFLEGDYLIIRRGLSDYQLAVSALFSGAYIRAVPHAQKQELVSLFAADPAAGCCVCEAALTEEEGSGMFGTELQNIATHSLPLTVSQENVVKRARQQAEIQWTPLANITGWRGNVVYQAGATYRGIPYAQPVTQGVYIPWGATLSAFAAAVRDPDSVMYTSFSFHGSHATIAPFFGGDCSSFVSWALEHPVRTHTGTFPNFAHRIAQNIYALQVGDVFNSAGHNLIVTAVEYDAQGNLAAVETMEQTIPLPQLRRYGVGGCSGGLQSLVNRTFNRGFALYRSTTIGNVSFTPDPAVDVGLGPRHIITATAGPGGLISPSGPISVPRGNDAAFHIQPNPGFSISRVLVNGVNVGTPPQYTFTNVTSDFTISAEFVLTGSPFADVSAGDWYYEAVLYTFREGLMSGTSATNFSPYDSTTRSMFVTILGRMAGVDPLDWRFEGIITGSLVRVRTGPGTHYSILEELPRGSRVEIVGRSGDWYRVYRGGQIGYMSRDFVESQRGSFTDVAAGTFYAPFVEWANDKGIVTGTGEGSFRPGQVMTRQEMATLLFRYIEAMGIVLRQDHSIPPFADLNDVADWAREAVTALQRAEVISGMGGNRFGPQGESNRASVATMIANFHKNYTH